MGRRMSYPTQTAIVVRLPFAHRFAISGQHKAFETVCEKSKCTLKHVAYFEIFGEDVPDPQLNRVHRRAFRAALRVESVEWRFHFDVILDKMVMECSLFPGARAVCSDRNVARASLDALLQCRIEHLEIQEHEFTSYDWTTDATWHGPLLRPLDVPAKLRAPRGMVVTWRCNRHSQWNTVKAFKELPLKRFELVDLVGFGPLVSCSKAWKAEELVVHSGPVTIWDIHCSAKVVGLAFKATMQLISLEPFVTLCSHLVDQDLEIGSFYTGIYRKNAKNGEELLERLLQKFPGAEEKNVGFEKRNGLIIRKHFAFIVAVFHNYFEPPTEETERFTVIKLPPSDLES